MTITFPRTLPSVSWARCDLALSDPVRASASGARLVNYTQVEDPVWTAEMETIQVRYEKFSEIEAWWLSLRDGLRSVMFRHPTRGYPMAHRIDRAPADKPGNLLSVSAGNVLEVSSVDSALVLSAGDLVGLERAGRFYIGRVTEASGTGTTRQMTLEPPPFGSVAIAGTTVRFANPGLVMRPVPGSFSAPREGLFCAASFQFRESP